MVPVFDIITYLPDLYPGLLGSSLIGEALKKDLWRLNVHNIHDFSISKHRKVDDKPFGGGHGLVMRPDVVASAIEFAQRNNPLDTQREIVYASAAGTVFDSKRASEWSQSTGKIFICGRFEGIDQRVLDEYKVTEISLGDFILCGGDSAIQVMLEATVRLIPGTVGCFESLENESFVTGLLEHAHYTLPREWNSCCVPDVLLSGNHAEIVKWRHENSLERTQSRRSDLWQRYCHR